MAEFIAAFQELYGGTEQEAREDYEARTVSDIRTFWHAYYLRTGQLEMWKWLKFVSANSTEQTQ
jgi:hypothetical protein